MKLTIRNTKIRDDSGQMVDVTFLGSGSVEDGVGSWLTDNPDALADAASPTITDWLEDNITQPTDPVIDASLSVSGAAADAKKTGDEIADLKSGIQTIEEEIEGSTGSGLTNEIKQALMDIAEHIGTWTDGNSQTYISNLYNALYAITSITLNTYSLVFQNTGDTTQLTATTNPEGGTITWSSSDTSVATVDQTGLVTSVDYGTATITATAGDVSATCSVVVSDAIVSSISAVYDQTGITVYNTTSLDFLKTSLVVTAVWSDSTTSTVAGSDYTLSGTLEAGTSTITVSYAGKTATFDVTVTELSTTLPEGYTEYDYVYNVSPSSAASSNYGQMVNTQLNGMYCGSEYLHELTFRIMGNAHTNGYAIYGCRETTGSDPKARVLFEKRVSNVNYLSMNYNGSASGYNFEYNIGTKYKSVTANGIFTLNDEVIASMPNESYTPYTGGVIKLWGCTTGGSNTAPVTNVVRIYGFKVQNINTGEYIAYMVPCKNANSVAGFYDIIRSTFYQATTESKLDAGNDE